MGNSFARGFFNQADTFEGKTQQDMIYMDGVVRVVQIAVATLIWLNLFLVWAAEGIQIIPGAALGGVPVTFYSLPHTVFLIGNSAVLTYGVFASYFDGSVSVKRTRRALLVAFIFFCISVCVNLFHGITLAAEIFVGTSVFYNQGYGFVIALMAAVFFFALWQIWIIYRVWIFRSTLENAKKRGWRPGLARLVAKGLAAAATQPPVSQTDEEKTAPANARVGAAYPQSVKFRGGPTAINGFLFDT